MKERKIQPKKTTTDSFSIPTLAQPTRGFGLQSSDASFHPVPDNPLAHDISRIPLRRPQTKLTVNQPGDIYEQQADTVAQKVVGRLEQVGNASSIQRQQMPQEEKLQMKPLANSITPLMQRQEILEEEEELQMKSLDNSILQRESVPEEEEEELQMKPMLQRQGEARMAANPDLEASINQARGGGQVMADNIREPMEQAFGADFSGVKVHTDGQSDQLNQSIQARAFTTGQDVFFRQGEYNPGSRGGQELLAHELTHVVQQSGGMVERSAIPQQYPQHTVMETISASATGNPVIQRANEYYPNGDAEPHIHIHDGGITFTSVGHRHKNLVAGDQIRQAAINEVLASLREAGDQRSLSIVAWIEANVGSSSDEAPSRVEELKSMLIETGGLSENTITIFDDTGNSVNYEFWVDVDEAVMQYENQIEESYQNWQKFQNSGGQVLLGERRELTEEEMSGKNL